jgi:hypothetical protein
MAQDAVSKVTIKGPVTAATYTYRWVHLNPSGWIRYWWSLLSDTFDLSGYSKCGDTSILNIVSSIQVDDGSYTTAFGYISDKSANADFQEIFGMCIPGSALMSELTHCVRRILVGHLLKLLDSMGVYRRKLAFSDGIHLRTFFFLGIVYIYEIPMNLVPKAK